MSVPATLRAQIEAWLTDEAAIGTGAFGADTGPAELRALVRRADNENPFDVEDAELALAELTDRFSTSLSFGTAGLRGPMRAGQNGMNTIVVRKAAAGLASYLLRQGHRGRAVVIGYDGRHGSQAFARDSAAILRAAGFEARLLPRMLPTPVLAYAVRELGAAAGVMVTASHNPPRDNGYKVYAEDGAQLVPPMDRDIEAEIRAIPTAAGLAMDGGNSGNGDTEVPESLIQGYVNAVAALVDPTSPRAIRVAHTALHGVGAPVLRAVFAAAGFPPPLEVAEQADPDPDFPTVAFPNPEEAGALDLVLALAARAGADLVIANDPDADRCAVAVPLDSAAANWRMLTGDDLGVLLADWLLTRGVTGTFATTIASSTMLAQLAERHGVGFAETLTGFKWIARAAPDLVYGYEEALGYAVAPQLVRDKDGISAALLVTELAATLKARGSSLLGRLAELGAECDRHATRQLSWRVRDPRLIGAAMARLRQAPPATLLNRPVSVRDLAPAADVVILGFAGGRVVIRPSGTEPKCKAYLELVWPGGGSTGGFGPAQDEQHALESLAREVTALLAF